MSIGGVRLFISRAALERDNSSKFRSVVFLGFLVFLWLLGGGAVRSANDAAPEWYGQYEYNYDGGRTVGGSSAQERYALDITVEGAKLSIVGFQSDELIYCDVKDASNGVDLLFRSYGNGATTNKFGVEQYRVGDVLLSLAKRGAQLRTTWGTLTPDSVKRSGAYFRRLKRPEK